jgi:hypothetical protein
MRWPVILVFLFCTMGKNLEAQELFTYSEPASNMAAKSIGVRLTNYLLRANIDGSFKYQLNPELMWGISKKWMVHAEALTGADDRSFKVRGVSVYSKYRFYSKDDVHKHFRMALYGRGSLNTTKINQEAIDLQMFHSGYELGWVGTELIQKWAFSLGFSGVKNFSFQENQRLPGRDFGWNYNVSVGKLIFPLSYENYNQTNLNLMAEFPGQYLPAADRAIIDAAPSLQLIFASRARLDFGYRFPLVNDLYRPMDRGFLLRFEYNFFNAIK